MTQLLQNRTWHIIVMSGIQSHLNNCKITGRGHGSKFHDIWHEVDPKCFERCEKDAKQLATTDCECKHPNSLQSYLFFSAIKTFLHPPLSTWKLHEREREDSAYQNWHSAAHCSVLSFLLLTVTLVPFSINCAVTSGSYPCHAHEPTSIPFEFWIETHFD